jgi:hypothetical protein
MRGLLTAAFIAVISGVAIAQPPPVLQTPTHVLPLRTIDGATFKVEKVQRSPQGGTLIMVDVRSPVRLALKSQSVLYGEENHVVKVTGLPECTRQILSECPDQVPLRTWLDNGVITFDWPDRTFRQRGQTVRFSFGVIRADTFGVLSVGYPPILIH